MDLLSKQVVKELKRKSSTHEKTKKTNSKRNKRQHAQVKASSNTLVKRSWDKQHACPFCETLILKLPRHMELHNMDEVEVQQAFSKPKASKQRRYLLDKLRYKGDYIHNIGILKKQKGQLIPWRCPPPAEASFVSVADYLPCPDCLAFFSEMGFMATSQSMSIRSRQKNKEMKAA